MRDRKERIRSNGTEESRSYSGRVPANRMQKDGGDEEMKGGVERGWRETPIYASVRANIGSYRRYNDILSVLMRTHRYRYVHRRFARYVCAPVGREAIAQLLLPFPGLRTIRVDFSGLRSANLRRRTSTRRRRGRSRAN